MLLMPIHTETILTQLLGHCQCLRRTNQIFFFRLECRLLPAVQHAYQSDVKQLSITLLFICLALDVS